MRKDKIVSYLRKRKFKLNQSLKKICFNLSLNQETKKIRSKVLLEAENALGRKDTFESKEAYASSIDPIVTQGYKLKAEICSYFENLYLDKSKERILIQVPDSLFSPAGFSLYSNIAESLAYIGIPTEKISWGEDGSEKLLKFKPTVLMVTDHAAFLSRINWDAVARYKSSDHLLIGLSSSLEEYENTPLLDRLEWAKKHAVDFYFSFRDKGYLHTRKEYKPYFNSGYQILLMPFGANISHYYAIPNINRDLNFALIASRKREHMIYMSEIAKKYSGFIDGPGWNHIKNFNFNRDRDRYIYARAMVGLNVHLPEQIDWACELNERTYQLAACGTPQLIDHPLLLDKAFSPNSFFIAENPREYTELFNELIANPLFGQKRALIAQQEVFSKHTTFHRAASFVEQLTYVKAP